MAAPMEENNPVPAYKKKRANAKKRLARLRQRVRNVCKIEGMPTMALIHVTTEGAVKVVGDQAMVEAVAKSNIIGMLAIEPKAAATTNEAEKVDLRRVSVAVDYADVRDVHLLRRAVTQVTIDKGAKGSRSIWGDEGLRPFWWPERVPFVAPSATQTDYAGIKHRLLTAECLRLVMCRWKNHVISKLNSSGFLNSADSPEVLEQIINKNLPSAHSQPSDSSSEKCCGMENAIRKNDPTDAISTLVDGHFCAKHLVEIEAGDIFQFRFSPNFVPNTSRQFAGIPTSKVACGEGGSLWEIFGGFPDVLVLATFAHGYIHQGHYAQQFIKLGETAESLGERFGTRSSSKQSLEDVVADLTQTVLAGPSIPNFGTVMLLAGALERLLVVHMDDQTISSQPCPCLDNVNDELHVYMDRGGRAYCLKDKAVDETIPSQHEKKTKRHETPDPDQRIIMYQKLFVTMSELDAVMANQWLDDHVIDTCLSILRDENDAKETVVLSATTGFLLQAERPQYQKLKKMTRSLEKTIVPICTGTHWYLLAVGPETAWILCSMGGRYRVLDRNIKRLFGKACKYPEVPKQTNGRDCGVYTVMYAEALLKESKWTGIHWPSLVSQDIEVTGRHSIYRTLMKWSC